MALFQPHELRHTAASLAIASGSDVKVVQQMLGRWRVSLQLVEADAQLRQPVHAIGGQWASAPYPSTEETRRGASLVDLRWRLRRMVELITSVPIRELTVGLLPRRGYSPSILYNVLPVGAHCGRLRTGDPAASARCPSMSQG